VGWQHTTVKEIKAYLGFQILKGINVLPSDDDYWKRDSRLYYHPIASRISRDRLADRGSEGYDRLGKIRPALQHLTKRFEEVYRPGKELAIDEAMIKFQGRSSLKQYMPMKLL
jgi:hypothetical protein